MSAPQPNGLEAARAAGRAEAEALFAERDRQRAERLDALRTLDREGEGGRLRLAVRYGNDNEQRWATTPDAPQVDPVSLLYAFLGKAMRDGREGPELEREDALAAAHMIRLARRDAEGRDINVMRHIVRQGVSWDELAYALDTTPERLQEQLWQQGAEPDTWIPPTGELVRGGDTG